MSIRTIEDLEAEIRTRTGASLDAAARECVRAGHVWREFETGDRGPASYCVGLDPDFAERSRALAANQGLYTGFLVAGLVWGLVADRTDVQVFFLGCVVVAGVFGAATVNRRILLVQALPAAVALVAVLVSR